MTTKEYYNTNKAGFVIDSQMVAPRISQSGEAIQYIVKSEIAQKVIKHLADAGITTLRTQEKNGYTAIEAK
jgi:hypothetical protein